MHMPRFVGRAFVCVLMATSAQAAEQDYGRIDADFRLRHESVDQDNALQDANANTLRIRLGFGSKDWNDFSFAVQGEAVAALGGDDYNSGPGGNGKTMFSVIPDPEGEQINQLWLAYGGLQNTKIKLGRQRIIYDNARFVGNVGWRQNEQTFDGISIANQSFSNTVINFAHLVQVNNIFFQAKELDKANLLNLSHEYAPGSKLAVYAYYLDYAPGDGPDHRTVGLRGDGELIKTEAVIGRYKLEYATQSDYADSQVDYEVDYSLAELALLWRQFNVKAGIETLGGDGTNSFKTPLATLHAFNGWADQFLSTPMSGLADRYVGLGTRLGTVKLGLVYHDFISDVGSIDHGTEWNASAGFSPAPGWSLLLKYADYTAQDTSVDTRKLWLQVGYKFQ